MNRFTLSIQCEVAGSARFPDLHGKTDPCRERPRG